MSQQQFKGNEGLERLKALIAAASDVRGNGKWKGTQEFLLGWVYGLADAGAIDEDMVFSAQQFIGEAQAKDSTKQVELYLYPSESYRRVEGKSMRYLEEEIMAGGPHHDSRVGRIYRLAAEEAHPLYYVAKHWLFLSRARQASV